MRDHAIPETGAKRTLLEAAERLFAEHGFDGVSVRDITQLSKANVAAVHYHFGNREGLVRLVMLRHLVPVNEERLARLEAAERKSPKGVPVEELLEAWLRPVLTASHKSELDAGTAYKLIGRIFAKGIEELPTTDSEPIRQGQERFSRAFAKTLPSVAADELASRLQFVNGAVIHILTHPSSAGETSREATLGRLIRFAAAGMREGTEQSDKPKDKGAQATFGF